MKKILSALTGMLFLLAACNNTKNIHQNEGYTIKGTLKGMDSGMVKLVAYNEDERTAKTLDSVSFTGGTFELKGKAEPQMVTVSIKPGNWAFQVFLDDTTMNVTADTTGSKYYDYTMYDGGTKGAQIKDFTVTGSKNFDDWMKYQDDPVQKKYEPVFADLDKKIETTKDIDQQYKYRDQADSVRKLFNQDREIIVKDYIAKNPSSIVGAYMLKDLYNWYSDMPLKDMIGMTDKLQGDAKQSKYYVSLQDIIAKRNAVAVGSLAPDFTLMKRDSSKLTLSSTRGKYVMIDFWASWCHPCRQAIPHWKEVYAKYHDKGFDILSVSDDSKWKDWFKAMDVEKMPWTQVCDEFPIKDMPARVGSLYMTTYIPFYVLLDKDGKVLVYSGDENKIDEKLKEIFGS
ncbi:MAG: TlpA disulfide reductase family protein [Ginsengibacter sp.]